MRYLRISEILKLHKRMIERFGGAPGVRDIKALQAAVQYPHIGLSDKRLYTGVVAKAAVLCYAIITRHPFVDGNKRVGHAAMEITLILNGLALDAPLEEQETMMLSVASGEVGPARFIEWVHAHVVDS